MMSQGTWGGAGGMSDRGCFCSWAAGLSLCAAGCVIGAPRWADVPPLELGGWQIGPGGRRGRRTRREGDGGGGARKTANERRKATFWLRMKTTWWLGENLWAELVGVFYITWWIMAYGITGVAEWANRRVRTCGPSHHYQAYYSFDIVLKVSCRKDAPFVSIIHAMGMGVLDFFQPKTGLRVRKIWWVLNMMY